MPGLRSLPAFRSLFQQGSRPRVRLLAVAALVVLAGCGGSGGTDPAVVTAASGATVADDALAATGYAAAGTAAPTLNTSVSASLTGDVEIQSTRDVTATLRVARYRRDGSAGRAAVASVPSVTLFADEEVVANVSRNPAGAVPTATLVDRLLPGEGVEGMAESGSRTATLLGNETTVTLYGATRAGRDVTVAVASVRDGEDYVTVVAVYPAGSGGFERLGRLLEGVQH